MKSSGGKLSTWLVRETPNEGKRLYNTYLLTSTVTPLKHADWSSYSVRIRNSEGSTDVSLYLMYEGMLWYFLRSYILFLSRFFFCFTVTYIHADTTCEDKK